MAQHFEFGAAFFPLPGFRTRVLDAHQGEPAHLVGIFTQFFDRLKVALDGFAARLRFELVLLGTLARGRQFGAHRRQPGAECLDFLFGLLELMLKKLELGVLDVLDRLDDPRQFIFDCLGDDVAQMVEFTRRPMK